MTECHVITNMVIIFYSSAFQISTLLPTDPIYVFVRDMLMIKQASLLKMSSFIRLTEQKAFP